MEKLAVADTKIAQEEDHMATMLILMLSIGSIRR
jgi:hypothetical protein